MDGVKCAVDEIKPSEESKSSDNKVSIYKDDPERSKMISLAHHCLRTLCDSVNYA